MVPSLYVAGVGICGKTVISYGLINKFEEEGLKVAYFKPVSVARKRVLAEEEVAVDADVVTMKDALGLEEPYGVISPYILPVRYLEIAERSEEIMSKIRNCYNEISKGKDLVVVEGRRTPDKLCSINLCDAEIAKLLGSKMLLIAMYDDDYVADQLLSYNELLKSYNIEIIGVIFNNVPMEMVKRVEEVVKPFLVRRGLDIVGIIPERPEFSSPTVREVSEALEAEVLDGEEYLDKTVEDFLCGAMSPETAIKWFRRAVNAAIITGGDRTDLILAALETRPSAVILTGNLYPSVRVLTAARDRGVPVLLVPYDTYTTIELVKRARSIISAETLKRRHHVIMNAIDKNVDWREILRRGLEGGRD